MLSTKEEKAKKIVGKEIKQKDTMNKQPHSSSIEKNYSSF